MTSPPTSAPDWLLDPAVTFLNHGSFGACPRQVLAVQSEWRQRMERNPVAFLARDLEGHLDAARASLAEFVGAAPADLAFVTNATMGVNAVLRSLEWRAGDEILVTSHVYNACLSAARAAVAGSGAAVRIVEIPYQTDDAEILARVLAVVGPRTRLALLDHVTSPTAVIMPIERLVTELQARGVDVLVDGAHAPGMLPLDLDALGATYYTGNCHKWMCAPKGSAFLHVRSDRRAAIHPLVVSHGANSSRTDRSRFHLEFDWTGTADPTAWLAVPAAIETIGGALDGGWPAVRAANHALVASGGTLVWDALGTGDGLPHPDAASMLSIFLPGRHASAAAVVAAATDLEAALRLRGFEVPIVPWPSVFVAPDAPAYRLLVRVSAQLYNRLDDYVRLALGLRDLVRPG